MEKSRTIEIIDNHIKALEEELEWYQDRNVALQNENAELHRIPPVPNYLKLSDYNKALKDENARLREQLRWHSVDELPPYLENVVLRRKGFHDVVVFYNGGWYETKTGFSPVMVNNPRWCYIPDDNQGTDCTQEGE